MKKTAIIIALMIAAGSANAALVNGSLMIFTEYTGGSPRPLMEMAPGSLLMPLQRV